ncbi:hypothetical protein N028_20405 [Pseudomonas syringae USA011]|nr:hypothetical protein N028_20405 [Pseudomonas syringae USA011]
MLLFRTVRILSGGTQLHALGFGEGHLLHQASRRLRSDVLPNLEVFPIVSLVKASLAI